MIARRWFCRPHDIDLDDPEVDLEIELMGVEHDVEEDMHKKRDRG